MRTFFSTTTEGSTSTQEGSKYPDVIANLRVDQAWGSARIMGVLHDASGQYVIGANNNGSSSGGSYGFGLSSNIVDVAGANHLTATWGFNAAYEHVWSPRWQTSAYSG